MSGDAGEDVGEPGLRVDVVHLGRDDQAVHGGGALPTTIGAGEQPRLPSERDAAQGALGSVVAQADAAVIEEAGEGGPTLQHVIDGLRKITATRELRPFGTHPGFEVIDERPAPLLSNHAALVGGLAVDAALDLE